MKPMQPVPTTQHEVVAAMLAPVLVSDKVGAIAADSMASLEVTNASSVGDRQCCLVDIDLVVMSHG